MNSNQIEPREEDITKEYEKLIWYMENPPESTCMSGWYTFMRVRQEGVKVTLDGQGADEQLAGYLSYIPSYLLSLSLWDFYKELLYFLKIPGARKQILMAFLLVHTRLILNERLLKKIFFKLKKRNIPLSLNLELKNSIEKSLVTLIHYSDHVSMGHSIESRMPFMDYRLVEFLANVPASYKMHNGWTKYLARLAFDKKLPDEICWRKDKLGWPIPEEYWFRGGLKNYFVKTIEQSQLIEKIDINFDAKKEIEGNKPITKLIRYMNVSIFEKMYFK